MNLQEIKDIRIEDFDYTLPDERIAKYPLADRDSCKLLCFADGKTSHHTFSDLPDLLPSDALLVMNNTRVINARMEFHRASGARIEIFLLEPLDPRDYAQAFQSRHSCRWQCLVGNLKKWKDDHLEKLLEFDGRTVTLRASRHEPLPGNAHAIEFTWDGTDVTFASIVEAAGNIPIPPYLNRDSEASDTTDYQTVYSRIQGSVAAPTAGLHFTPGLLDRIRAKGIGTHEVTLHVGAGTFQPVKSDEIGEHPMHRETFEVSLDLVRSLREAIETGRPVIAVGTTTVRTLESLPLLAVAPRPTKGGEVKVKGEVGQWEAYEDEVRAIDTVEALKALERHMEDLGLDTLHAATSIMIAPGFKWRIVDGMVTNFHQPQSTLLLLVSSLLDGDNLTDPAWRRIYKEALDNGYRFLSYGDACLFLNDQLSMINDQLIIPNTRERTHEPCVPTTIDTSNVQRPTHHINIPGSKSIAARALVCRLLGGHDTVLTNLPDCGDTRGMLRLTEAVRTALRPTSNVKRKTLTVDIGEGGTTLRFGMAACASIPGLDIILTASPRLMERPHDTLLQALRDMGADITLIDNTENADNAENVGKAPKAIHIRGRELSGGIIRLDGSVSSQYLSALMLAAPVWKTDTTFILDGKVVSRPYIEMTAGVMRAFGADVQVGTYGSCVREQAENCVASEDSLEVRVRATGYAQCARYDIEGDWSGASYFFELRLIAQALGIKLPDFEMPTLKSPAESLQGDSRVAAIFADASRPTSNVQRPTLNLNDAPDLVPAVAVGFCVAGIPFRIEGVAHLRHKETDRMAAIATELRRLGYVIATGDDTMVWDGSLCQPVPDPLIRTYQDHRMAMAFAPARLAFPNLRIEDPTVVEKSFPDYWTQLNAVWPQFEDYSARRADFMPKPLASAWGTGQVSNSLGEALRDSGSSED